MAFEEIKAKLGLDITAFEQGAVKAQGSLKTMAGEVTKKFTDMKNVGQTLATAIGLNVENIAEGVARMVVGFSKTQEEALNRLVDRSKSASDEMAKMANQAQGGDDPQKRIELLNREEESIRLAAQGRKKLTTEEKLSIINKYNLIEGIARISAEEEAMAKQVEDAQARLGEIGRERLSAEQEIKKKAAEKDKKDTEEVAKNFAAAAEERKKRTLDQMSDEDKLKALQEEQTQALKDYNDTSKTAGQRSEAKAKSEKLATEIQKTTNDIAKKATDSANERLSLEEEINKTKEDTAKIGKTDAELLADMEDKLFRLKQERDRTTDKDDRLKITLEIAKKEQEIKKAKQDALDVTTAETTEIFDRIKKLKKEKVNAAKPTLEGIESGERKVPYETRELAKSLRKNEADRIKAADTLITKNVAYNKALKEGTTSEKRRAKAELDAAKFNFEQLGKQEQKIKEQLVGQGVNIGEELIPEVFKPAAPKPEAPKIPEVPKPAAPKPEAPKIPEVFKPAAPISVAEAALTAAQGQVTQAQNQLTAPPAPGGSDIAGILGSIKTGIDNLNTKLESTAIK